MKLHFLTTTALSLAVFSSLVSPIFTSSSRAMDDEKRRTPVTSASSSQPMTPETTLTQVIFPTTTLTRTIKKDIYHEDREVTNWEMLNSCRSVSNAWKKEIENYIVANKLFTFYLTPDNYKDERTTGLAPLVTFLRFTGWEEGNLEEIGSALRANSFPSLQKLTYWAYDDKYSALYTQPLEELGSKSLANALNQELKLNPCPQLKELWIAGTCHPILWKSLDQLPNLRTLKLLNGVGDLSKHAKKLSSLKNITSLSWNGHIDRLGVYKLYKELKKTNGEFEKLDHLNISSFGEYHAISYAEEQFKKLQESRPNIKFELTYK